MTMECFVESEIFKHKRKQDLETKSGKRFFKTVITALIIYIIVQAFLLLKAFTSGRNSKAYFIAGVVITLITVILLPVFLRISLIIQKENIFRKRNLGNIPCYIVISNDEIIYAVDDAQLKLSTDDIIVARETEKCFTILLKENNESISIPKQKLTEQTKINFSAALSEILAGKYQNLCY